MNRGPRPGVGAGDHVEKARFVRGGTAPEWVIALARKAVEIGQKAAGDLIGYSGTTVSEIISNKYRGDLAAVEISVRGALMGATVDCPGLDKEIGLDRCRTQQKRPFSSSSPMATRLSRACRACPNREVKS